MPDCDQVERGLARNGPGQQNPEQAMDQKLLDARQRDTEAAALAQAHYAVEPGLRAIYRLEGPDPNDLRIKLLEVNDQTIPSGIVPVGFAPHPASGLHYPSVVIEVTPLEYQAIQHNQLNLPPGWQVREPYERPANADRAGGAP